MRWQKWSFVIGFNAREGLTLHHLRYDDGGRERSVLYRASLTEMVVPYGDPAPDAGAQERLRRRRVRHGHVRQQPANSAATASASSRTSTPTCATAAASR